jgi:hypothetical protein
VCIRILATIEDRLVRSLAAGGPPSERLERSIGDLVDLLAAHPNYARLLLRSMFEDDDLPQDGPEADAIHQAVAGIMAPMSTLLKEGMGTGEFRLASVPHVLLLLVGPLVFPFASGEFGEEILGKDVFDPAQVARLRAEVLDLVRGGLVASKNDSER